MEAHADTFSGGFADAVHGAQTGFKVIMDALAQPGTLQSTDIEVTPPAPMIRMAGIVALTLCDADTQIWLAPEIAKQSECESWLRFHTNAVICEEKSEANYCFIGSPKNIGILSLLAQGTQEYPDRSATLIVPVDGFETEPNWVLSGPGIQHQRLFKPLGVEDSFLNVWANNRTQFPRGVDLIFASQTHLAALPRTTKIHIKGAM